MYHVLIADDHAVVRSGLAYLINQQPNFEVIDDEEETEFDNYHITDK